MNVPERRGASRYQLFSKGYIVLNGVDLDLKTHDISSCGVLVELSSAYSIGTGMELRIHLDIGHVCTAVVLRSIADTGRTMLALQFQERLPETILH